MRLVYENHSSVTQSERMNIVYMLACVWWWPHSQAPSMSIILTTLLYNRCLLAPWSSCNHSLISPSKETPLDVGRLWYWETIRKRLAILWHHFPNGFHFSWPCCAVLYRKVWKCLLGSREEEQVCGGSKGKHSSLIPGLLEMESGNETVCSRPHFQIYLQFCDTGDIKFTVILQSDTSR